jgi:hypothetical protein
MLGTTRVYTCNSDEETIVKQNFGRYISENNNLEDQEDERTNMAFRGTG